MIYVGLGGAIGAMLRYALSLLPLKSDFPLVTLLTNLLGAVLIGLTAGLALKGKVSKELNLFLKTGICGGFTTFSTFSLESFNLIENGKYLVAIGYMVCSVILCLLGVFLGMKISKLCID